MPVKKQTPVVEFEKLRSIFFIAVLLLLSIAVLYIFRPFFYPILWAAIIAVMLYPAYTHVCAVTKSTRLGALLMILFVIVLVILPLGFIFSLVINQALNIYNTVSQTDINHAIDSVFKWAYHTPLRSYAISAKAEWPQHLKNISEWIANYAFAAVTTITQNSLNFLLMFFIMLYTLFFFFKDGPRMLKRIMHLSPLGDKYEAMLYSRFTSVVRATIKGSLIIGGLQGIVAGILFWATGVNGALLLGLLTMIAAIIPLAGAVVVWIPVALYLLATGDYWQALTVALVGGIFISNIDNFLRPPLVGKDIEMHPLLVLFSTLGGVFLFGISGIIIGPIITALYLAIMNMYDHYYRTELSKN